MTKTATIKALLATTALLGPLPALAQGAPPASPSASMVGDPEDQQEETLEAAQPGAADPQDRIEISGPGASRDDDDPIIIRGTYIPSPVRATPEVVSVLSAEDIARTGDGDIASALERVTGLSVVGGRFVYVRGLGERYSSALLNGAPLPSPEPLRRVVPLDLFPTSVIASTVVQKTYSANYPGEFGGGVINLTTRSAPEEGFFSVGGGVGFDSETSLNLGYTYYGGSTDFLGYDDGKRALPANLKAAFASGNRITPGENFSLEDIQNLTASLDNASTNLIQTTYDVPVNWSGDLGAGQTFEIGAADLGVILVGGISNSWRTRQGKREFGVALGDVNAPDAELFAQQSFDFVSTQNRVVVNGMASTTLSLDDQKVRLVGVYIRDALKEAQVKLGENLEAIAPVDPAVPTLQQGATSYFERELYDGQVVGEFEFGDFNLDLRGSYAKSRRDAPYERAYSYVYSDEFEDYVNDLRSPGNSATLSFSELDDELWFGAVDLAWYLPVDMPVTLSAGYAYSDNSREAIRRDFDFFPQAALPDYIAQQRIDYLLSDYNVYTSDIILRESTGGLGSAAYEANLETQGAYGMLEVEPTNDILLNIGVRYEDGSQSVTPQTLFGETPSAATTLERDYWLPAGTLTWNFADDMQFRLGASKTIARPQFRELAPQPFVDYESGRTFFGSQFLTDSEILNLDARYEWYFDRDQIFSLAGFFKEIDNPIESAATNIGSFSITSFANAPKARLYGAEVELRKYFPFYDMGLESGFLGDRRIAVITNYTYTNSELVVGEDDTTISFVSQPSETLASSIFNDGAPLTGQSEHLVNLQLGLENEERLSQQTFLLTYASDRVTARGPNGTPDYVETPGVNLDFVWREGFGIGSKELELKGEVRNILGTDYEEIQTLGDSELLIQTYERGTSYSLSASLTF
ncbi:TonB-dependent receptor domain-containing protein [Sphingomicrobium aestuariivivum]|uniref:TonB-dependent receptor domain-containing protein n=1 Tax=Sphingomicrobium aestuariivivum TaxID=1582356 RepID=UPI001FD69023|nr:TonB-dependent receptor [Sphingomicrobium aestuariivivum]MCJ8191275.1 TonB-dependent receptor [Sphingomicrobium aestuariivivum]